MTKTYCDRCGDEILPLSAGAALGDRTIVQIIDAPDSYGAGTISESWELCRTCRGGVASFCGGMGLRRDDDDPLPMSTPPSPAPSIKCDACDKPATILVRDSVVDDGPMGATHERHAIIGRMRAGCDDHPVTPREYRCASTSS